MMFFKKESDLPQYIFLGYMTLLLVVLGSIIYFAFVSINFVLIKAFHTKALSQNITVGSEPTIVGNVLENIVENTSTSSPAYLVVKTDRGRVAKVRYSVGKKEDCVNYSAAQVGFFLTKGDKIQAFGKAVTTEEMNTCSSNKYYIKVLNGAGGKNGGSFELNFSISGSIFGHSYKVKIAGQSIEFHEYGRGPFNVIQEVSRPISDAELGSLSTVIDEIDLVHMDSQDFRARPLLPDQAHYEVLIKDGGEENTVKCGLHLEGTNPALDCQKALLKLREKISDILNVEIK